MENNINHLKCDIAVHNYKFVKCGNYLRTQFATNYYIIHPVVYLGFQRGEGGNLFPSPLLLSLPSLSSSLTLEVGPLNPASRSGGVL